MTRMRRTNENGKPMNADTSALEELCERARAAAQKAYAPYSGFRVGAAVKGRLGIHTGANVENASYGLTLCAERVALAFAVVSGDRHIEAIALACIDADPARDMGEFMPCGACRQWMAELAAGARVIICGKDRVFSVAELLPIPFELANGFA
jgi:cytidine deaminase